MKQSKSMVTGSTNIEPFIQLGEQPNGNIFFEKEDIHHEKNFTLNMSVCKDSWLVQLDEFPTPEEMFSNHPYISGYSKPVVTHFTWLSKHIIDKFALAKNSLVVDIGANDGTLLSKFRENGMLTLGVDPGGITGKLARENGLLVARTFWNQETGNSLKQMGLVPNLITATAVFYHIPDLHQFVKGLYAAMDDKSIFMAQCVNLKDVIEKLEYDHFYHEHTCIYSVTALKMLFEMNDMKIISVEHCDMHGGSVLVYATKKDSAYQVDESVERTLQEEEDFGIKNLQMYHDFAKRVKDTTDNLVALLKDLKAQGKTVFGLGAPVKGSTLLNYGKIGPELVSQVVEVNPHKIGRVVPGVHIPVVDESTIEKQPDYYLLLAWNFKDFFIEKYKDYLQNGGKFIVPNPEVHIFDKNNL